MAGRRKKQELSLIEALKDLCAEKDIAPEVLFTAVEDALKVAYKKNFNQDDDSFKVEIDRLDGSYHVYSLKVVVDEVEDSDTEISEEEVANLPNAKIEDGLAYIEVTPKDFGRIAAQAAKQSVLQKLREAERNVIYDEFTNRDSDLVKGKVVRVEDGDLIVEVGKTEAILVPSEQTINDNYKIGDMVRAYIVDVKKGGKGPQVYLSRTHPNFLRRLFELEVPEIQDGLLEIKGVAREAGSQLQSIPKTRTSRRSALASVNAARGFNKYLMNSAKKNST